MASCSKSEQTFIRTSLTSEPPLRVDGRSLLDVRPIALETRVAPLANGSAKINIGGATINGVGVGVHGTEVIAAVNLEVGNVKGRRGKSGRISCNVICSPSAYAHLNSNALEDMQYDYTAIVQEIFSHSSLLPQNLTILPGKKAWLLHLDLYVLSDNGNIFDALFLAAAAALRDTRVPKTRSIEYEARKEQGPRDRLATENLKSTSAGLSNLNPQEIRKIATDFELVDYHDEGEPLDCERGWPVCVTLNLLPPVHYLDATHDEEYATSIRLLLFFSFQGSDSRLHGMRLIGPGEADASLIKPLIRQAENYARELQRALDGKLNKRIKLGQGQSTGYTKIK